MLWCSLIVFTSLFIITILRPYFVFPTCERKKKDSMSYFLYWFSLSTCLNLFLVDRLVPGRGDFLHAFLKVPTSCHIHWYRCCLKLGQVEYLSEPGNVFSRSYSSLYGQKSIFVLNRIRDVLICSIGWKSFFHTPYFCWFPFFYVIVL